MILQHECHLHLYGCLDPQDFWQVAASRAKSQATRFQWFLSEYERTTGVRVDADRWWSSDDGFARFKQTYVCDKPVSFEIFQAKFNLLIALFPPSPDDLWLAESVFKKHSLSGGFKEYRTFLPLYLPTMERTAYLRNLLLMAKSFTTKTYHPRIAVSLMRADEEANSGYKFLRHFLDSNPDVAHLVTGIDFCASEKGHPPKSKQGFFKQVHADNKHHQHLAILYHVGEMWQNISLASAARWCVEAATLGAHRLGHALALGMDINAFKGSRIHESLDECRDHLNWIRLTLNELQAYGFGPADYQWLQNYAERHAEQDYVIWTYDEDLIEHTTRFQDAAMQIIAHRNCVIESCPTSNMRIGQLKSSSQHPLRRFLDHGLEVVVSTDDPGIFDISLASEEALLRRDFSLSDGELQRMNHKTQTLLADGPNIKTI
jgi:hypothetical protein